MTRNAQAKAILASGEHVQRVEALRADVVDLVGERFIAPDSTIDGWLDYARMQGRRIGRTDRHRHRTRATSAISSTAPERPACRKASCTTMRAAKPGVATWRWRCATTRARGRCATSACSRTSSGSACSRRFSPAARSLCHAASRCDDCLETIQKHRVTHSTMVPLQFQKLLEHPDFDLFDLSSLDACMCCGSPLSAGLKRELAARWPGQFIELYGLTEGLVTILSPEDLLRKDRLGRHAVPGAGPCDRR